MLKITFPWKKKTCFNLHNAWYDTLLLLRQHHLKYELKLVNVIFLVLNNYWIKLLFEPFYLCLLFYIDKVLTSSDITVLPNKSSFTSFDAYTVVHITLVMEATRSPNTWTVSGVTVIGYAVSRTGIYTIYSPCTFPASYVKRV